MVSPGDTFSNPSPGGATARKAAQPPKKPVSADRRLQNRKAQKAYRDRKRERLRELESKLASLESAPTSESQTPSSRGSHPSAPTSGTLALGSDSHFQFVDSAEQPFSELPLDAVHDTSRWDDIGLWLNPMSPETALPSVNMGESVLGSMSELGFAQSGPTMLRNSTTSGPESIQTVSISPAAEQSRHGTDGQVATPDEAVPGDDSLKLGEDIPKTIQIFRPSGKHYTAKPRLVREYFLSLPKATQEGLKKLAQKGDFSFVDTIQSLFQISNRDSRVAPHRTELLSPAISGLAESASFSPYRNVLRISRFSYFAALFANFSSLGFDFSLFLDESSVSPFLSRSDPEADNIDVPSGLRPLPSQRTVPHHPYIDTLPFPTFRRRALAALSTDPPLLDEDDLCIDLMLNDGLVCWGSATQNGMDHGTPWDSHSWEAKGWFLRKWWWLIGGQDSELYHSSQWWASQRGERVPLLLFKNDG